MILDYSYARPSPAAMKAAGAVGVMRYLSPTVAKNLSAGERDGLHAAGLTIGLVWESTATRAGAGYLAGQVDGQYAENRADALGYPATCPIFYAVDFAASPAAVAPYFQGVQSAARRPVGVYGSAAVVEGVPVPYKWQTTAWSGGRISPLAHLYQRIGSPIAGTDANDLRRDLPMWAGASLVSHVTPLPAPVPIPAPGPAPVPLVPKEDDMVIIFSSTAGYGVLAGARFVPIADQATVDAYKSAGVGQANISDKDFHAARIDPAMGLLLYNPPEQGGKGWAHLVGGRAIPLHDQSTVDALAARGADTLVISSAEFDGYVGAPPSSVATVDPAAIGAGVKAGLVGLTFTAQ